MVDLRDGFILIKGARTHNLKGIDISIPVGKITVIVGVSGSGKSSLALDTLYAEGQRRYIESFSPYARQFLEKIVKPVVDEVRGIFPAIAISRRAYMVNPRSTVGTITEIYDYLRLLYAKIGEIYCYKCGRKVEKYDARKVFKLLSNTKNIGKRIAIFFPFKGNNGVDLKKFIKLGYDTILIKDAYYSIQEALNFNYDKENVYIYVDSVVINKAEEERVIDSLEIAFRDGAGSIVILLEDGDKLLFDERLICPYCLIEFEDIEPSHFSFNSPKGACPVCQGFGNVITLDMKKIIPDENLSLKEKPIAAWNTELFKWFYRRLAQLSNKYNLPMDVPFKDLKAEHKKLIIEGNKDFLGIKGFFEYLNEKKYKVHIRIFISQYRKYEECSECKGSRLKKERLFIKLRSKNIYELATMDSKNLLKFIKNIGLTKYEEELAGKILYEIERRLEYLDGVGLGYLSLNRQASTLSGGELQRINLAAALGTNLTDTIYVLDEPSVGLHFFDNIRLIQVINRIKDLGNTVVIVEHDKDIINYSDYIIELGPGAGEKGGRVIFSGDIKDFIKNSQSLTAKYYRKEISLVERKKVSLPKGYIKVKGAREHNLKNIDMNIPLGQLVCITGVSGSGKSTLVEDVIYAGLKKLKGDWKGRIGICDSIQIQGELNDAILVNQLPPSKNPKSLVVTYTKAFEVIRELFANTLESKIRSFTAADFSFHSSRGRCSYCEGNGYSRVEMLFLSDMIVECEYCKGKRYKDDILEIKLKNKNISEVLDLTVNEAIGYFDNPKLAKRLQPLLEIGLEYLKLGQSLDTLSAGEAQRIKIANFLANKKRNYLYIFDEPTIGLHPYEISKLIICFEKLLELNNSIIVIEHNINVIRAADYIIDLGPAGGDEGGYIIAEGKIEDIIRNKNSLTGKYLSKELLGARSYIS